MTKRVKQVLCLVLAMAMFAAFGMSAMAATITITGGVVDQEYSAYKIFEVTSAGTASYAYTIDTSSQWYNAVVAYAAITDSGLTLTRIGSTDEYNVTIDSTKFDAKAFSEFLSDELTNQTYGGPYVADGTATAEQSGSNVVATMSNMDTGYYFVTTNLGSLCILNTITDDFNLTEKNEEPSIDKDLSTGQAVSVSIGDTVSYTLTITVGAGYNGGDYVVTDTLPDGLTYTGNLVISGTYDNGSGSTTTENWVIDTDYTVDTSTAGQVEITLLSTGALAHYTTQTDTIVITYDTVLNDEAIIDSLTQANGNVNTVELSYGDSQTVEAEEKVYTYRFGIEKTSGVGSYLAGATFSLTTESGDQLYFVPTTGASSYDYYRLATDDEVTEYLNEAATATDPSQITSSVTETVTTTSTLLYLEGLAAGTYILTETEAPAGYSVLTDSITVTISDTGALTFTSGDSKVTYAGGTIDYVKVTNTTSSALPTTGGIGTTIFYVVGAILMAGAAIVLITRRRMRSSEE